MTEQPTTKLVSITQGAGDLINKSAQEVTGFVARVSNPSNQMNFDTVSGLLRYCIQHNHWSIFEHAFMTVEITTTMPIAEQMLRHRSFTFQKFSGRYAKMTNYLPQQARRQDEKNRQNSVDDLDDATKQWFLDAQETVWNVAFDKYQNALDKGIAKECARFLLPTNLATTMYMTGSARSWIHYLDLRMEHGTQLEHTEIAKQIMVIFNEQFPDIAKAMGWSR